MSGAELRRRVTRRAIVGAACPVLLVGLLLPLFGAHYYGLDLSNVDLGLLCQIDWLLSRGETLWLSPHLGRGSPLFANPHAQLLYPPRWPALLLPPDWGVSYGVALHLAGAAGACAWLARTFGLRPATAALAGVSFATSGTVIDLIGHQSYLITAAYLPLAWASARAFLHPRGRARHMVILCLALALCVLGGEPQGFAMGAGAALFEGLLRFGDARARLKLAFIAVAAALAVAMGLVQLLPTLAEARLSGRLGALNLDTVLALSMDVPMALSVVLPVSLMALVEPGVTLHSVFSERELGPWNAHAYLGLVVVAAALAALPVRRLRSLSLIAGGGLLCAVGGSTFVYPLLVRVVPGLGAFRYPAKYFVVVTLAAIVLAFATLDTASRARRTPFRLFTTSLALFVAALAAAALLLWRGDALDPTGLLASGSARVLPLASAVVQEGLHLATAPLALLLILLRSPRLRRYLPLLATASVVLPAIGFVQAGPTVLGTPSVAAAAEVEAGQVVCVDERLRASNVVMSHEHSSWNGLLHSYALGVYELAACHEQTSPAPYSPLNSDIEHLLDLQLQDGRTRIAQALGCEVMIAPSGAGAPNPIAPRVVAVEGAIPDAFVVEEPSFAAPDVIVDAIFTGERDFLSLVDDPADATFAESLPSGDRATLRSFSSSSADRLEVELEGTGGAVVAFRNSFRMGWTASQTGEDKPVVRISGTLLGVVIEDVTRGPVVLSYRPRRLVTGAIGTVLGALGLALLGALGRWRLRRS